MSASARRCSVWVIELLRISVPICHYIERGRFLPLGFFLSTCEIFDRGRIVSKGGGRHLEGGAVPLPPVPVAHGRHAAAAVDDSGGVEHAGQKNPFWRRMTV